MNDTTIVIGAGITGLSAAHTLCSAGQSVTVLEASDRIGGRIVRLRHGEDAAEAGGQGIHSNYREMYRLLDHYGLKDDLMPQPNTCIGYLDRQGVLRKTNGALDMLKLLGPRGSWDFARFSAKYMLLGKKFDLFETSRDIPEYDDVSSAEAFPWAGRNFMDYFVRPATDAACNTTPPYTSLYHLLNLTRQFSSTKVFTLRTGNVTLAERIARAVPVRLGTKAVKILTDKGRVQGVLLEDGKTLPAGHVIVTSPMHATSQLLPDDWTEAISFASSFQTAPFVLAYFFLDRPLPSEACVSFGHAHRDAAFNMTVHHTEKSPYMVKSGKAIISAWTSFPTSSALITQPDDAIVRQAQQDLDVFYPGFHRWVERAHVQRHHWGVGQLGTGMYGKILSFKRYAQTLQGVSFASNDLDGVHMESGIRAGQRAAQRAMSQLN